MYVVENIFKMCCDDNLFIPAFAHVMSTDVCFIVNLQYSLGCITGVTMFKRLTPDHLAWLEDFPFHTLRVKKLYTHFLGKCMASKKKKVLKMCFCRQVYHLGVIIGFFLCLAIYCLVWRLSFIFFITFQFKSFFFLRWGLFRVINLGFFSI